MYDLKKVGAVVLAAGKGTRLGCQEVPKVMLEIGNKPILGYIINTLIKMGIEKSKIAIVVGYQKQSILDYFEPGFIYTNQREQLGTAHAAFTGIQNLPKEVRDVLVVQGDDSAFYTAQTLVDFISSHILSPNVLSLLTAEPVNYQDMGRVLRDENGNLIAVVEKEELDNSQRNIKEISTGTYVFDRRWFEEMFENMPMINGLREYGLPQSVIEARKQEKQMQAIKLKNNGEWFGINTTEELNKADSMKKISV